MSDWSDDYSNTNLSPVMDFDFDSFMAGIVDSLPPVEQQIAASLGGNDIETYLGASNGTNIGGVASGSGPGSKVETGEKSSLAKWWSALSSDDKKIGLSVAGLLSGGLANMGKGRREDKSLQIQQQYADANTAGVAERARQFNQQMANASSIGQTNFGTATQPMGMINAPVTLTRNRLKPTPGMPA